MPRIDEFRDEIAGQIDFAEWRLDIRAMLRNAMEMGGLGISTREFCSEYFENEYLETVLMVGNQLQIVRRELENEATPHFLLNENRRWYMVNDPARARQFLVNRTQRMLRQYERLERYVEIGRITYALESYSQDTENLIRAIETSEPGMRQLREALEIEPPEDEEG